MAGTVRLQIRIKSERAHQRGCLQEPVFEYGPNLDSIRQHPRETNEVEGATKRQRNCRLVQILAQEFYR